MGYGLRLLLPLSPVLVLLLIHPASVVGSYYIQQAEDGGALFPPYIFMAYGPAPESSIALYQTTVQLSQTNQTTTIFNSHVNIDSLDYAYNNTIMLITPATTLQPFFNSFFANNRLEPQTIPQVSNISVEMAPILNPLDVQWITQIDTGPFVPLNKHEGNYMPSFSIPPYFADGFYLIQLTAFFPDQAVKAVYTNTLCLGECVNAVLASEGINAPYDNASTTNDFLSSFNQTNIG